MTEISEVKQKAGYHHGDLRDQLVAATRQLVEEKGPDNFSVSEACRQAGVSTAAPYRHFADRQEMLRAVSLQGMAEMTSAFQGALEGHRPGSLEAITAIGCAYVDFAVANPGVFRMMFAEHGTHPDLEEAGQGCYGKLLGQVAAALGKTEPDEEVLRAGFPLWTFVHGTSFLLIDGKADFAKVTQPIPDLIRQATERLMPEATTTD